MTEGETNITKSKVGIRLQYCLLASATALMLYRCYIPGQSGWNALGAVIWLIVGSFWLSGFFRDIEKLGPLAKQPVWPICTLFCLSLLTYSSLPQALGLGASLQRFEEFACELRQKPVSYKRNLLEPPAPARMQLGIYPIYDYAVDGEGGVYFVTTVSTPFINTELNGFAYKPSHGQRLFGRIGHSVAHLWGNWYTFEEVEKF